jgi:transposase
MVPEQIGIPNVGLQHVHALVSRHVPHLENGGATARGARQEVLIVQRWILARLRNARFFSLAELNVAIRTLVDELNARLMRKLGASRREFFDTIDRPALMPLPAEPCQYAEWRRARVAPDYHVEVAGHFYSVPSRMIRQVVEVRATEATIEVFHRGSRIASHARSAVKRRHTTIPEHMPSAHRRYAFWTPARLLAAAEKIGPSTVALCETIMRTKPHPEQGFRSCLGILRLEKTYGAQRLEAACRRGISIGAASYRSVASRPIGRPAWSRRRGLCEPDKRFPVRRRR